MVQIMVDLLTYTSPATKGDKQKKSVLTSAHTRVTMALNLNFTNTLAKPKLPPNTAQNASNNEFVDRTLGHITTLS